MKISDIFENISKENTEKLVKNIIVMFMHNNNYSITIDAVRRELRKQGVQVEQEFIENIAKNSEYDVRDSVIYFTDDTPDTSGDDVESVEYSYDTPAEQLAKDATRKALRGK